MMIGEETEPGYDDQKIKGKDCFMGLFDGGTMVLVAIDESL